jgi:hypothetical protein
MEVTVTVGRKKREGGYVMDTTILPTRLQALDYVEKAEALNPGPWADHSRNAGRAAELISVRYRSLDPEKAYIYGCLHDIGRIRGKFHLRHTIDGYDYMMQEGYNTVARICLTHSFPTREIRSIFGANDCTPDEYAFINDFLRGVQMDGYDMLVQLCDALATDRGFCLLEKRMVDVVMRYGPNEYMVPKWKAVFDIKNKIERDIGGSIYDLLPGVVENTFS